MRRRLISTGQCARGKCRQTRGWTRDASWNRLDGRRAAGRKINLWRASGPGFRGLRRELDLGNDNLSGEDRGRGSGWNGLTGRGAGCVGDRNREGLDE